MRIGCILFFFFPYPGPLSREVIRPLFVLAYLLCLYVAALYPAAVANSKAAAYSGNPRSMIYHNSGCRYFGCKACVVRFSSPAEARKNGYRACKVCRG